MTSLVTLLCAILADLRAAIGAHLGRDRTHQVLLTEAWARIGRMSQRLQTLYTRWQTGTLPKPRPSRAGKPWAERPARPYFPRRHAWLAASTDHQVRSNASQLAHLLTRADAEAFLTAVPRAGRILRPLCRMLGIAIPTPIALPPQRDKSRPHKPRPRIPRLPAPPREPPRHGKYTPAQLRRYTPGRIPATPQSQPSRTPRN